MVVSIFLVLVVVFSVVIFCVEVVFEVVSVNSVVRFVVFD